MTAARLFVGVSMAGCLAVAAAPTSAQEDERAAVGATLASVFNPQLAPPQKTMGLVQRSFLDAVEQSQDRLEIALVIDGTESMGRDLEGVRRSVRQMIEDLRLYKGADRVAVAMAVFRDIGAPSGPAQFLLKQFTAELDALEMVLPRLEPETGAPYFPEMVDYGVHAALTELPWSDDPQTTRWIILFTDAPPYDPDFVDSTTGARRSYDTDVLATLAKTKGIQIHGILCGARPEETHVYEQVLDKTRKFLNDLAGSTGGNLLDLSYPDIRKVILEAARQERIAYQPIGRISQSEIEAARRRAQERVRLAILPHLPLDAMTFDPTRPEVQLATELRSRLRRSDRIDVVSPVDLERRLRATPRGSLSLEQFFQALALQVRADFVIWGDYLATTQGVSIRSAVYSKDTGEMVAEARNDQTSLADAVTRLAPRLAENARRSPDAEALASAIAALGRQGAEPSAEQFAFASAVRREVLAGMEALEQAMGRPLGDREGQRLLEQSNRALRAAVELDPQNPLLHMLWANCFYNQAEALRKQGRAAEADQKRQHFLRELRLAWTLRDKAEDPSLRREIEGDYELLINKNAEKAVEHYTALTQTAAPEYALRAHWMLAGIRSGDWGVPAELVQPEQARRHLIEILAHWPESHQAQFIRQSLRWSDQEGRTQFAHFPKLNQWAAR